VLSVAAGGGRVDVIVQVIDQGIEQEEPLPENLELIVLVVGQVGANAQKLAVEEAEQERIVFQDLNLVAEDNVLIEVVNDKLQVVIRKNAKLQPLPLKPPQIVLTLLIGSMGRMVAKNIKKILQMVRARDGVRSSAAMHTTIREQRMITVASAVEGTVQMQIIGMRRSAVIMLKTVASTMT